MDEVDDTNKLYWLPLLLSINFHSDVTKPIVVEKIKKFDEDDDDYYDMINDRLPIRMAAQLLPLLSEERFIKYNYWIIIGKILYNITRGAEMGLELWIKYSEITGMNDRNRKKCIEVYDTLDGSNYSIRTLGDFAEEDSKISYDNWHEKWCKQAFIQALSLTHYSVAEAVARYLWKDYGCGDSKKSLHKFEGNGLLFLEDSLHLRKDIIEKIVPKYRKMRIELFNFSNSSKNRNPDDNRKKTEEICKQISLLISKLEDVPFQNKVIEACRIKFLIIGFKRYINNNHMLLGFKNGVIECTPDLAIFRQGRFEDYLTINTGTNFKPNLTKGSPEVRELLLYLSQVFPDREILEDFLKKMSTFLRGKNMHKKIWVWLGCGNNSKTMLAKLIKLAWGKTYFIDFPPDILCGTIASNGPTPALAQAKTAYGGFICEPDANKSFDAGKTKLISGGDDMFARFCNDDGGSMEMNMKPIILSNNLPRFEGIDKPTKERIDILLFTSKWSTNPPESIDQQRKDRHFKIDPNFESKLPFMAPAFMWLLVQYYAVYCAEIKEKGYIEVPEFIKSTNEEYWKEHDPYIKFMIDELEMINNEYGIPDIEYTLSFPDIYPIFVTWWKTYNGNRPLPESCVIKQNLLADDRLGQQNKIANKWTGVKPRNTENTVRNKRNTENLIKI